MGFSPLPRQPPLMRCWDRALICRTLGLFLHSFWNKAYSSEGSRSTRFTLGSWQAPVLKALALAAGSAGVGKAQHLYWTKVSGDSDTKASFTWGKLRCEFNPCE